EFLYQDGQFHFNEMNTRLQVEHPVTEMVTGLDLVQWQLRIAAGEHLTVQQEDVRLRGHALECRINAEDPAHDFRPSPGTVRRFQPPSGEGVRVDTALREGWVVPSHYDSMVLKLLVHAGDRTAACDRMLAALDGLGITGFTTNKAFHQALFGHDAFRAGELTTRFLEDHDLLARLQAEAQQRRSAALAEAARGLAWLAQRPGGLVQAAVAAAIPPPASAPERRDWRWEA
ncbi:MAG TPA: acetyl-CoA carboxylase biotin carboxylase subunit, partial [Candidatus Thermoplasmatota archaeon]|nr:acetyl-CoA carboxylase biotin carboxylase subunit [Candidatus Thermoplasmatota archaeon]